MELMGSGIGSISLERLVQAVSEVFHATVPGGFKIARRTVPLAHVEKVWSTSSEGARTVFTVP